MEKTHGTCFIEGNHPKMYKSTYCVNNIIDLCIQNAAEMVNMQYYWLDK